MKKILMIPLISIGFFTGCCRLFDNFEQTDFNVGIIPKPEKNIPVSLTGSLFQKIYRQTTSSYATAAPWQFSRSRYVQVRDKSGSHVVAINDPFYMQYPGFENSYSEITESMDPLATELADYLEECGFSIRATEPKYTIYIDETGSERIDFRKSTAIYWCSLTLGSWQAYRFTARVRIYNTKTGTLIASKTNSAVSKATFATLIPIFGTLPCDIETLSPVRKKLLVKTLNQAVAELK